MTMDPEIPWKHQAPYGGAPGTEGEETARILFRELARPAPLSPAAWGRIRSRVRARARVGGGAAYGRFALRFAVVALLVMGGPLTVALGWRGVREVVRHWSEQRAATTGHGKVEHLSRPAGRSVAGAPEIATPSPAPLPTVLPAAPSPGVALPLAGTPLQTFEPLPSVRDVPARDAKGQQLFEESRLLAEALRDLRARHPADALGELSLYRSRYPRGLMAGEASLTEVRAELDLGLDAQALRRLEELAADDFREVPRPDEARLLRAELLARGGGCGRAMADFDGLLASPLESALEQRALYGRAACRSTLGDTAGGRADLARYLEKFPDGQFAGSARQGVAGGAVRLNSP